MKHKQKANPYLDTKQQRLAFQTVSEIAANPSRTAESMLAMAIAEHCSILAIDHIRQVVKKAFADSKAASDFKLHRTKCTEVIKQVLGPHFLEVLVRDLGDSKYSLLLDESTDISVSKYLGVVIRYFSDREGKVISTFLGLVYLDKADATTIAKAVSDLLKSCEIKMSNLVGIGTDNASVMTGVNNGLHQILKAEYDLPQLVLVRCVCHSLQLAVSHASQQSLPRNIEFLVRETYNWFSISPNRRQAYRQIYEVINCGENPLAITKVCATRWLSIEPAVSRILNQWCELQLHFELARRNENCYTA